MTVAEVGIGPNGPGSTSPSPASVTRWASWPGQRATRVFAAV